MGVAMKTAAATLHPPPAPGDGGGDRALDGPGGRAVAEMIQHHGAGPEPMGLAMPWPAMSGPEPCTGSNIEGCSGFKSTDGVNLATA